MDTPSLCSTCGKPLPAESPHGLCPECLLNAAFPSSAQSRPDKTERFAAPSVADLAALFPQLEIIGLIGQGGMGAVFRARQPNLDRTVALKILPPRPGRDPGFAERFMREARALARLSHPNIVAVHDFGQAGDYPYLLMEYVDGVNLRHLLSGPKMAPREALAIVPQICDALQFAHDRGVVHRDIKPDNILVDRTGTVKIADFGLAKIVGDAAASLNMTGASDVMGTPHYMAPEQIERPLAVDHRADIYALGVVFYQMLTGELPLGRFAPPSRRAPVDLRLDHIVLRALEREPDARYQQARSLKTEVEAISSSPPPAERNSAPEKTRQSSWVWLASAAALLVLIVAGGITFTRLHRTPPPVAATAAGPTSPAPAGGVLKSPRTAEPEPRAAPAAPRDASSAAESRPPPRERVARALDAVNRPADRPRDPLVPAPQPSSAREAAASIPDAPPFTPPGAGRRPFTLTPGPADYDSMESNPEILRIQIEHAERELDDVTARRSVGAATSADVQQATDRVALLRAKLEGQRLRFAQIKVAAAEQRLADTTARYSAGIASGLEVDVARQDLRIERIRAQAVQAAGNDVKAGPKAAPP